MWDRPNHFHTPHPKQCRSKRNATPVVAQLEFKNKWEATIETYDLRRESMFFKCTKDSKMSKRLCFVQFCSLQGWMTNLPVNIFCMRWIVISFCLSECRAVSMGQGQEVHARRLLQQSMAGVWEFPSCFSVFFVRKQMCRFPFIHQSCSSFRLPGNIGVFRLCSSICYAKYSA